MPAKKMTYTITRFLSFEYEGTRGHDVDVALQKAASDSLLVMGGKTKSVFVYAKTEDAARLYGGDEAVDKFRQLAPGEPLAVIYVKASSSYWK